MKSAYPVLFTKDEDGGYLVEVPDLGRLTEGKDINDAIEMARDVISLYLTYLEDKDKPIPKPTPIEKINPENGEFSEYGKAIISIVDVDTTAYRRKMDNSSVRRNVTLPKWLDMQAKEAKINVSKVLQDALKEKLGVA